MSFAHKILCSLRCFVANRSNSAGIAKEFSEMFKLDVTLVREMQRIDLSMDLLEEAGVDLPNPNADPLLDEENRTEFVNNIITLSNLSD
ncbi:hypothetical protein [Photobacterium leiognathi]|uniref:hypothetical protein n=1 Tax=Photobacterium leiognathi TaxID=553611 RepID=UPI0029816556|nr:hypothetical protein [Photobacterium leiognathi]